MLHRIPSTSFLSGEGGIRNTSPLSNRATYFQSAVFRQKPGPKPDRKAARHIAHAARRRARGTESEELYQRFIPDYGKLNPVTRSDADDGFRRKVNKYLQSHRRLRKTPLAILPISHISTACRLMTTM